MGLKQKIVDFLSGVSLLNLYFSGIAVIFMLHRVAPFEEGRLLPNENMKVSPEFLESFILELKKQGYEFISLDDLYEILRCQRKEKRKAIFTLDDGYKDNYEKAYPIFKAYDVPFTIYITTSFPNKKAILWWYALEDLILENDELILGNRKFNCKTWDEKTGAF